MYENYNIYDVIIPFSCFISNNFIVHQLFYHACRSHSRRNVLEGTNE